MLGIWHAVAPLVRRIVLANIIVIIIITIISIVIATIITIVVITIALIRRGAGRVRSWII